MGALRGLLADAWEKAGDTGNGYVMLNGGLNVVIRRRDGTARLSIGRKQQTPSRTEVEVVRRDMPALVPRSAAQTHERRNGYEIETFSWTENGALKVDEQLELAMDLPTPPENPNPTLDEQFERWANAHPYALIAVREEALRMVHQGRDKFGVKEIVERIRWGGGVDSHDGKFYWNNNFTSRAARWLVNERPELERYIEMRELRS